MITLTQEDEKQTAIIQKTPPLSRKYRFFNSISGAHPVPLIAEGGREDHAENSVIGKHRQYGTVRSAHAPQGTMH